MAFVGNITHIFGLSFLTLQANSSSLNILVSSTAQVRNVDIAYLVGFVFNSWLKKLAQDAKMPLTIPQDR